MKKQFSVLFLAAVVALLAAGCNKNIAQNESPKPQTQSGEQQASTSVPSEQNQGQENAVDSNPVSGGVAKAPTITVTQTVEGSNLNKPTDVVPEGETALDLLKRGHKVETKDYSGIGEFVQNIDGLEPDAQHFWAFYVNGISSNVGAASYKPKNGDRLEWKISKIGDYNK